MSISRDFMLNSRNRSYILELGGGCYEQRRIRIKRTDFGEIWQFIGVLQEDRLALDNARQHFETGRQQSEYKKHIEDYNRIGDRRGVPC